MLSFHSFGKTFTQSPDRTEGFGVRHDWRTLIKVYYVTRGRGTLVIIQRRVRVCEVSDDGRV